MGAAVAQPQCAAAGVYLRGVSTGDLQEDYDRWQRRGRSASRYVYIWADGVYPLPFHPLELSEAALLAMLGYQFEGHPDDWVCDPLEISIMKFEITKNTWWKFW